jgi:uncharacterized membrane protein (DUF485 family)
VNKKILFIVLLGVLVLPLVASADPTTIPELATNIQATAIGIGTPIVVIGWVIAGILYLTAAGSPEKTGTAKKAVIACVIGTVLIVLAIGSGAIVTIIKSAIGIS